MIPKYRFYSKRMKKMGVVISLKPFRNRVYVEWSDNLSGTEVVDDKGILMQSTGLFDKNGKEVFIGDIVRCTSGCPHEVYIEKEYGGTFIGGMPAIYFKGIKKGYAWTGDEEILGNIYENPELIESVEE